MSLLGVIITIALIGFLLWLINKYIPMEGNIKKLLNIAVIILIVLWLFRILGVFEALYVPVGALR